MDEFTMPAGFDKIWERVCAKNEKFPLPITEGEQLEKFICTERYILALYAKTLEKCQSKERAKLVKLTAKQRQSLKILQVEYFIKNGDIAEQKKPPKLKAQGVLSLLRELHKSEGEIAGEYMTASGVSRGDVAEIYREIAEEKRQRCAEIKAIIRRNM